MTQLNLLLVEDRKIKVPYELIEDAIVAKLEDEGFIADSEILLDLDLGFDVDDRGLVELDATVTWERD